MPTERYLQRVADHVCVACGKRDERTLQGRPYCRKCADAYSARSKALRDERRENGLCPLCGRLPERDGAVLCDRCRIKLDENVRRYRTSEKAEEYRKARSKWNEGRIKKLKESHACIQCGEQDERTLAGHAECQKCADYHKAKIKARSDLRVSGGLCTKCGQPNPDPAYKMCPDCRAYYRKRAREYNEKRKARKAEQSASDIAGKGE